MVKYETTSLCEKIPSFCLVAPGFLQKKHAEEQADGHRPQEVQHGPQEGANENHIDC